MTQEVGERKEGAEEARGRRKKDSKLEEKGEKGSEEARGRRREQFNEVGS